MDATWGDVCRACWTHTPREWGFIGLFVLIVLACLYFFIFALDLMGNAAKVMGGCTAGALFGDIDNPIAGLTIGILATVLLQSSSTSTSIVVTLVGAGTIPVQTAIYVVMGCNIGTSVTNTIVAMGQMGDKDQLEKAFAAATVHDVFNLLSVLIQLPLEAATKYLYWLTYAITPDTVQDGDKWTGPLATIVGPLTKTMIIANKKVINEVSKGASCNDFYPTYCNGPVNYNDCTKVGLIKCNKDTGGCPAFFRNNASQGEDELSGWVCFFISIIFLVLCLVTLIKVLSRLLLKSSKKILRKATSLNGYLAICVGCGITILVQSSSITTSVLTPLAGLDVLTLEVMYPITLGANIGTTVTGILAALVSSKSTAMQIALAHLFFNIFGIIIWYPIPWMRQWPLRGARWLGYCTRQNRFFPIFYIIFTFFVFPLSLLGISILWDQGIKQPSPGLLALGIILTVLIVFLVGYYTYQFKYGTLKQRYYNWGNRRSRKNQAIKHLADDMDYLKAEIERLKGGGKMTDDNDDEEDGADEVEIVKTEPVTAQVPPAA